MNFLCFQCNSAHYYYIGHDSTIQNVKILIFPHTALCSCFRGHFRFHFSQAVAEKGRDTLLQLSEAYDIYKADGMGAHVNEALVRFAFLAELGYEQAQSNAAFILDKGEVPMISNRNISYSYAFTYWARAASQGYVVAR